MSEPILVLEGLSAGYAGVPVVRDLSLTVEPGEVVVLLGANGAGKTTTLRAISQVVKPMTGEIRYAGQRLGRISPEDLARRGVAHVPEGRGVFAGLTVAEHFRLGRRGERLDEAYAYSHFPALRELRGRRAGLLSGGEQQMLALGRALARRPRLLLVDELSLGLAPVIVQRLLPIVRDYASQSGAGVLLVEQHVQLALTVADRGYVLAHGNVVQHSAAAELRRDRHLIIASYLGESRATGLDTGELSTASVPRPVMSVSYEVKPGENQ